MVGAAFATLTPSFSVGGGFRNSSDVSVTTALPSGRAGGVHGSAFFGRWAKSGDVTARRISTVRMDNSRLLDHNPLVRLHGSLAVTRFPVRNRHVHVDVIGLAETKMRDRRLGRRVAVPGGDVLNANELRAVSDLHPRT